VTELVFRIEIAGHFDSWYRAATGVSAKGMGLLDTLSRSRFSMMSCGTSASNLFIYISRTSTAAARSRPSGTTKYDRSQEGHSTLVLSETPFTEPEHPISGNARPHWHSHAALLPVAAACFVSPVLRISGTIFCCWPMPTGHQETAAPTRRNPTATSTPNRPRITL